MFSQDQGSDRDPNSDIEVEPQNEQTVGEREDTDGEA